MDVTDCCALLFEGEDLPALQLVGRLMRICRNENVNPVLLVKHLSDRAGLLIPRGVGVYSFPHRTFQEYMAACHLTSEQDYPGNVAELARHETERWREITLLAAANVANAAPMIWLLVEALCRQDVKEASAGMADAWGALLAGQALVETANPEHVSSWNQPKLERVRHWLIAILTEQAPFDSAQNRPSPFPAMERALAGNVLAQLGDIRPGVDLLEDTLPVIAWCEIPAGEFTMGSDSETVVRQKAYWEKLLENTKVDDNVKAALLRLIDSESPQHRICLSPYQIGRYPVTNAQYQAFILDCGYREKCYWTDEGWSWKEGENINGPEMYGGPSDACNHPIVGVSWHEATAFCRWLTQRLRERGKLSERQEIRLPTEAEWEKASRGGMSIKNLVSSRKSGLLSKLGIFSRWNSSEMDSPRIYPWGDAIDSEHANYTDTGLGITSPVGCFPRGASPYGCEEMAGNVWEWCWDWYSEDFYQNCPEENPPGPDTGSNRVVRGGGWGSLAGGCRSATRNGDDPGSRDDYVGFRLLRTPS